MTANAEDVAALQQFCLLAKSAKGAACASLIGQALDHPGIFVFGELLDMPSVKEVLTNTSQCPLPCRLPAPPRTPYPSLASQLAGTAAAPHLQLLQIFAWGTWTDYKGACRAPRSIVMRQRTPHVHVPACARI